MQLLFPPGGVIIVIFLICLLFRYGRKKIAHFITIFLAIFLFLFSSWLGEYILLRPLEDDYDDFYQIIKNNGKDLQNPIMVVLGGGIVDESLSGEKWYKEIAEVTLARLYGAFRIYQENKYVICVSGGTVPGISGNISSADVMEKVLIDMGVAPEDILKEDKSRTTFENAIYALKEIKELGYKEIILVTSAVHMRRSLLAFDRRGFTVIPAPVNFLFENKKPGLLEILPNQVSWNNNSRALHEWVGLLYYRLIC